MSEKNFTKNEKNAGSALGDLILAGVLVGVIVAGRLLPHPANFAPTAAVALLAGVKLRRRWALVLPLIGLTLSDFLLPSYSLRGRLVVYGTFCLVGLIGWAIRRRATAGKILLGSLSGSVIFFLLTNCVWLYSPVMYPHTTAGQLASYINGLPFFRATLAGDLCYTGLLFGAYYLVRNLVKRRAAKLARAAMVSTD
ncbi:MAG: hypothetical protein LBM73_03085 [Candidatus Nomurabacteria bacterium]|jgi:hypothetical protein|nr:hypothetical protein [Candidatus Nomurabacteria bacterium]